MIEFPNGKRVLTPNTDTTAYLPKGSIVYNGARNLFNVKWNASKI